MLLQDVYSIYYHIITIIQSFYLLNVLFFWFILISTGNLDKTLMHTYSCEKISLVFRIHMMHKHKKRQRVEFTGWTNSRKFCTIITLHLRLVNSLLNALVLVFHLMPLHNILLAQNLTNILYMIM